MAVDLDSGTGLFDRLGKIGYLLNTINSRFGGSSAGDFPVELNDILVKYDSAGNAIRRTVEDLLPEFVIFQTLPSSFRTALRTAAENTLIEMVDADNPLTERSVDAALAELIEQMVDNAESVDASAVSATINVEGTRGLAITAATQADPVEITSNGHGLANGDVVSIYGVAGMTEINNRRFTIAGVTANTFDLVGEDGTGHTAYSAGGRWSANFSNAEPIVSLIDSQGKTLENALAESIVWKINSNATAGGESGSATGEVNQAADPLEHLWPDGSGATGVLTIQNPSDDPVLTNGDFQDFTVTDTPDSWTIDTGSAGSDVLESTSVYRGSKCLEIAGDGATLTALSQDITSVGLSSRTPLPVSVRVKVDAVPSTGTLVIDLYDGSAVIADDEGNNNSLSIDLTAATTSYLPYTTFFRLPEPLPATIKLRLRLSVAIENAKSAIIDDVYLGDDDAAIQLYDGGPYLAAVIGSVNAAIDDKWTFDISNDGAGAFQRLFRRLFQQPTRLLPSNAAGGETVSDGLIA